MQEQKLESQFAELQETVDGAVSEDAKSKIKHDTRIKAILGEKECPIINCSVKEGKAEAEAELKSWKEKHGKLFRENEKLIKVLKDSASESDRNECLIAAMKDGFVQALNQETVDLRSLLAEKLQIIKALKVDAEAFRKEKDEYTDLLRTDTVLHEKWKQFKQLEERCAQMDVWYRDAYKKAQDMHKRHQKLSDEIVGLERRRDQARDEYADYKELVNHADKLLRKGYSVSPPNKPKSFFRWPRKKNG